MIKLQERIVTINMKVLEKYEKEINEAKKQGRKVIACKRNNEVKSLNYDIYNSIY